MRVRYRTLDLRSHSEKERSYVAPPQLFLTVSRDYEVHVVSVFDGVVFVLIVDDLSSPVFQPACLFEVVDSGVPSDWVCRVFSGGPVALVMGPEFIAGSVESYNAMVDQERAQVEAFWERAERLASA
jgi:hypothetical protein